MAEGYANSSYNWPNMNWAAADLSKEWERFYQHCQFTFSGPFSKYTEENICNLMSFVSNKGREIYLTFDWQTVQVGTAETAQNVSEKYILERVAGKFKAHIEAKKNPIMAAVKLDRRRQLPGETFDSFVPDLKLLAQGVDITETEKLIRNATACKPLDERGRQRCLEKIKYLTLDSATGIGRMFEATKSWQERTLEWRSIK